jgi:hypothetical protein
VREMSHDVVRHLEEHEPRHERIEPRLVRPPRASTRTAAAAAGPCEGREAAREGDGGAVEARQPAQRLVHRRQRSAAAREGGDERARAGGSEVLGVEEGPRAREPSPQLLWSDGVRRAGGWR